MVAGEVWLARVLRGWHMLLHSNRLAASLYILGRGRARNPSQYSECWLNYKAVQYDQEKKHILDETGLNRTIAGSCDKTR